MTAEAKTKDASKVVNMTISAAAKYIGLNNRGIQGLVVYYCDKNEEIDFSTDRNCLNKKGVWCFTIQAKTNISIYGTNIGMKRTKIHKILTKRGFKCVEDDKWTDMEVIYSNSNGYVVQVQYKTNKKNSKSTLICLIPKNPFIGS